MSYGCHPYWKIIYPNGNQTILSIAEMDDDDAWDYDIASRQTFHDEVSAYEYMVELAGNAGLKYKKRKNDFLD